MFANTIVLAISGVDKTLVRVNQDNFGSTYKYTSSTEILSLQFRNSSEKNATTGDVERHNMFVEHTVLATPTASEKYYTFSATLRMRKGGDPAALAAVTTAASTVLAAQLSGLVQGES